MCVCSVRNALVVVAASLVAFSLDASGYSIFTITGKSAQGLPPFRPPPTSDTTANGTNVTFGEIVKVLVLTLTSSPFEFLHFKGRHLCVCVLSRTLEEGLLLFLSWVCWRVLQ